MSSIHNFLLATLKKNELKRNFKNNVREEIRIQQLNEVFKKNPKFRYAQSLRVYKARRKHVRRNFFLILNKYSGK